MADDVAVWDMTSYFPKLDSPEYRAFDQAHQNKLAAIEANFAEAPALTADSLEVWARLMSDYEDLQAHTSHLGSYLGCLRSADTRDEAVAGAYAALSARSAALSRVGILLGDVLRDATDEDFAALCAHPELHDLGYALSRTRDSARKRMSKEMEALAADLMVNGLDAWGRLYSKVDGALRFELAVEGQETREVPMAWKRSLTQNADPAVRRAALEGSNAAWASVGHVVAASLNAIAGTRLTLYKRRGVAHFLDAACEDSAIERPILDAMMSAVVARQEVARRYLRLKARLLGVERLGFQDTVAPLPLRSPVHISWSEARRRVETAFEHYQPELGAFARHVFDNRWIDAEARDHKRSGGFCTTSAWHRESRIFMTFNHTLGDVQTLAHELGHAYHSHVLRDMRPLARRYPMTLAESASMFAEAVLTDSLLADPQISAQDRAVLLDTRMARAASSLLNIPMRYFFEKSFYEARAHGEQSVSQLNAMMLEAQRECYGDVLDEAQMDPWFWASKLHFYITRVSFYNFPYTFGHLFSQTLFERAHQEGPAFWETYKELLRRTGSASPETITRELLGGSLHDEQFWLDAMAPFDRDLEAFTQAIEDPSLELLSPS